MTIRTHTVEKKNPKNNQEWSWEETPEVLAAIEQLHKSSEAVKSIKVPNYMWEPTILPFHANVW